MYTPKKLDTQLLMDFVKTGVVVIDEKPSHGKLGSGFVYIKGKPADKYHLYNFELNKRHFTFDEFNIYNHYKKPVPINDLIVGALVQDKKITPKLEKYMHNNDYDFDKAVSVGYSETVHYEGESYDTVDIVLNEYPILYAPTIGYGSDGEMALAKYLPKEYGEIMLDDYGWPVEEQKETNKEPDIFDDEFDEID